MFFILLHFPIKFFKSLLSLLFLDRIHWAGDGANRERTETDNYRNGGIGMSSYLSDLWLILLSGRSSGSTIKKLHISKTLSKIKIVKKINLEYVVINVIM